MGNGWWSGHEQYSIAEVMAKYGFQASQAVAQIESAANQNISRVQADASRYGYDLSRDAAYRQALAQEMTAMLNKQGVVESADRYAIAQEFTATMNRDGILGSAEIGALAQRFTATESANAQKYTADRSYDSSIKYAQAQEFTATQHRLATEFASRVEAEAQIESTKISASAERYKAQQQLKETQRMAKAQEFSSKASMHGQVAGSAIQSSSSVVSSGFGAFNYGQRSFNQWAMAGTNEPKTLVERIFLVSGLFILTMLVLFVAMDIFGIPILATLSNIVAEAGARAVAFVEAVRTGSSNAGSVFSDGFASVGATIGGMLTALWDKMQDFFDWVVDSLTNAVQSLQAKF